MNKFPYFTSFLDCCKISLFLNLNTLILLLALLTLIVFVRPHEAYVGAPGADFILKKEVRPKE